MDSGGRSTFVRSMWKTQRSWFQYEAVLHSGPAYDLRVTHSLVPHGSEGHMTPQCLCCFLESSSRELGAQGSTVWTNQYFGSCGELEQFLLSNIPEGLRIGY